MRYKIKLLVGMYQCVSAVPGAFNVEFERGQYAQWVHILKLPSKLGLQLIVPDTCFGPYQTRLLLGACWPIVLLFAAVGWYVLDELIKDYRKKDTTIALRLRHDAIRTGVERALPLLCVTTFVLVPSISTRIFQTFRCDTIEIDHAASITKRVMQNDLWLSCDTQEYEVTRYTAIVLLVLWPVGIRQPVLNPRECAIDGFAMC
eukprot:1015416-Prymnesium_polylepis.1